MYRIRPKTRLFDDPDNASLPNEERSYAGDLVCCKKGKTPTEYQYASADVFPEVTVSNGDGTYTTTWTMDGTLPIGTWSIYFTVCCGKKITFAYQSSSSIYDGIQLALGEEQTLVFADEAFGIGLSGSIQVEDLEASSPFFPITSCGLRFLITGFEMEAIGDTVSITI